jgi:hypothetical protein
LFEIVKKASAKEAIIVLAFVFPIVTREALQNRVKRRCGCLKGKLRFTATAKIRKVRGKPVKGRSTRGDFFFAKK